MVLLATGLLACAPGEGPDPAGAHVCEGDRFAGDPATVAALAECTSVSGNLVLTGSTLVEVELPKLRSVDGNFSIWGNQNLTGVRLSQLERVGGYFLIEANDMLERVDFPMLASVNMQGVMHHADFSISGNALLSTCQAHALRDQLQAHDFAGSVNIDNNLGTCPQ